MPLITRLMLQNFKKFAYSALFDHEFAWNIDQGFASIRASLGFNFSPAF